jgi:hypothetical protein
MMGTTMQMTSGQIDKTTLIDSSATINTESETSSSTMNVVGSTTLVIAMPATQPSDDNTALIGGIVGGVVALLIVVGVIAFIVMRNRKAKANQQSTNDGHSLSPPAVLAQPSNSNYDRIDSPSPSHYSERANVQSPTQNHYDSLKAGEI